MFKMKVMKFCFYLIALNTDASLEKKMKVEKIEMPISIQRIYQSDIR